VRVILGAALAVSMTSCAMLNAVRSGNVAGAANEAARVARITKEINEECSALDGKQISIEEESGLGGAVMMKLAEQTKGIYVEPSADLGDSFKAEDWANKLPAPAKGPRTDLHVYLNTLGKSLASFSSRPNIDWKFVVVESDALNAYGVPGGTVAVTTGLLKLVENEAQLAGVLAHEIGHVTLRHSQTAYKDAKKGTCISVYTAKRMGAEAAGAAPFSVSAIANAAEVFSGGRFDVDKMSGEVLSKLVEPVVDLIVNKGVGAAKEIEADTSATELLIFSGYDPKEFKKLLGKLPEGGMGHPPNKERQAVVDKVIADNAAFAATTPKTPPLDARVKAALK
jgi:beta-barrel assembly-enhancing protease